MLDIYVQAVKTVGPAIHHQLAPLYAQHQGYSVRSELNLIGIVISYRTRASPSFAQYYLKTAPQVKTVE